MPRTIGEMLDDLLARDTREHLDRTEEPGTEADEATRLITDEGVGGNPSQQKPPIMSLDCWNRCWWYWNIWVPTGVERGKEK